MDQKTKKDILSIGSEIASLWGAECTDFVVNQKEKQVTFFCVECGEEFSTTISFAELKTKYKITI